MYKPQARKSFQSGPRGVADIGISDKKKAAIVKIRDYKTANGEIKPGGEYKIGWDGIPDILKNSQHIGKKLVLNVTLNEDTDKILFVTPTQIRLTCKFSEFPAPENEQPKPRVKETKWGEKEVFGLRWKVVEGPWSGLEIYQSLDYNFMKFPSEKLESGEVGYSKDHTNPRGNTMMLHKVMEALGLWDDGPIPYRDNLLPLFHKMAKRKGKKVELSLGNTGWVEDVTSVDFGLAWDEEGDIDDEGEETEALIKPEVIVEDDDETTNEFYGVSEEELDFDADDDAPDFDEEWDGDDS